MGELNPRWIIATILQNWHFYCVLNVQGFSLWQWYRLMHIYTLGKLIRALQFAIMIYRAIPIEETFAIGRFDGSGYIFSLITTLRQDLGNQWLEDAISSSAYIYFVSFLRYLKYESVFFMEVGRVLRVKMSVRVKSRLLNNVWR